MEGEWTKVTKGRRGACTRARSRTEKAASNKEARMAESFELTAEQLKQRYRATLDVRKKLFFDKVEERRKEQRERQWHTDLEAAGAEEAAARKRFQAEQLSADEKLRVQAAVERAAQEAEAALAVSQAAAQRQEQQRRRLFEMLHVSRVTRGAWCREDDMAILEAAFGDAARVIQHAACRQV
jgi:hypothetical protein